MVAMNNFFAPNIGRPGRIARAVTGVALIVAGLWLSGSCHWGCLALVLCGGFAIYEALRGWCLMRACGIKTKM